MSTKEVEEIENRIDSRYARIAERDLDMLADLRVLRSALTKTNGELTELKNALGSDQQLSEILYDYHMQRDEALAALTQERERAEKAENVLAAVVQWLEKNQPDVFRRGLWESLSK